MGGYKDLIVLRENGLRLHWTSHLNIMLTYRDRERDTRMKFQPLALNLQHWFTSTTEIILTDPWEEYFFFSPCESKPIYFISCLLSHPKSDAVLLSSFEASPWSQLGRGKSWRKAKTQQAAPHTHTHTPRAAWVTAWLAKHSLTLRMLTVCTWAQTLKSNEKHWQANWNVCGGEEATLKSACALTVLLFWLFRVLWLFFDCAM